MNSMNRRHFLGTTAAGTAAMSSLVNTARGQEADRKLKLGVIGCGWYGMVDAEAALKAGGVEFVALCDVDSEHLQSSADKLEKLQGKRPPTFKLHQDLLNVPGLEAVIIASPPHWHALHFLAALDKNLDIYCEKPLAYDVREGRAMVDAARRKDRIVQIGFQRRQSAAIQQAREYIQAGKAGRIIQTDVQIHYTAGMKDATPQAPPASLDWDLWCGPAPKLPYSPQIGHMSWRLEQEYGHGHLVDWGIHLMDATRWILDETMPQAVQAAGGIYFFKNLITTPDVLTAHFEFAKCPVVWRHRIWGAEEFDPSTSNGILFYGDKETVFVTDDRWIVIPRGQGKERQVNQVQTDMAVKHVADFLQAVRTRKPPLCSIADAYQSTATVKLAMLAYETGQRLEWDAKTESIPNSSLANQRLRRDYRSPWQHPYRG